MSCIPKCGMNQSEKPRITHRCLSWCGGRLLVTSSQRSKSVPPVSICGFICLQARQLQSILQRASTFIFVNDEFLPTKCSCILQYHQCTSLFCVRQRHSDMRNKITRMPSLVLTSLRKMVLVDQGHFKTIRREYIIMAPREISSVQMISEGIFSAW